MYKILALLISFSISNIIYANNYLEIVFKDKQLENIKYDIPNVDSISMIQPPPSIVEDIDGNVYPVKLIGNKYWMTENLSVTKYDSLSTLWNTELQSSKDATFESYLKEKEGNYLYNWKASTDGQIINNRIQGICPTEYHVPNKSEWENAMSANNRVNEKMRSAEGWVDIDFLTKPSENNAFKAQPHGYASGNIINEQSYYASFWSSTEINSENAYAYTFNHAGGLTSSSENKSIARSIRCVWDGQTRRDSIYFYLSNDIVEGYLIDDIECILVQADKDLNSIDYETIKYPVIRVGNILWMQQDLNYFPSSFSDDIFCKNNHISKDYNIGDRTYYSLASIVQDLLQNYKSIGGFTNHKPLISICPNGWRIPFKEDFDYLVNTVGITRLERILSINYSSALYDDNISFGSKEAIFWISDFTAGYNYNNMSEKSYFIKGLPYIQKNNGNITYNTLEISNRIPSIPCRCVKDLKEFYILGRDCYVNNWDYSLGIWNFGLPKIVFTKNNKGENSITLQINDQFEGEYLQLSQTFFDAIQFEY